jgi:hypothetical protein
MLDRMLSSGAISFISICIVAPIVEEMLLRGFLTRYSPAVVIAVWPGASEHLSDPGGIHRRAVPRLGVLQESLTLAMHLCAPCHKHRRVRVFLSRVGLGKFWRYRHPGQHCVVDLGNADAV